MKNYRVVLKDKTEFEVRADDVEVDCGVSYDTCGNHFHYYNFLTSQNPDDEYDSSGENVTVAAVAFELVSYIVGR